MQALAPDDFVEGGAGAAGSHPDPLAAAAGRLRGGIGNSFRAVANIVREDDSGRGEAAGGAPMAPHRPLPAAPASSEIEAAPAEDKGVGSKLSSGFKAFGRQITSARSKLSSRHGDAELFAPPAAPGQTSPRRYAPPTPLPPPRTPAQQAQQQAADSARDELVRVGLAAFAVAAYVRSVMEPRLARRTVSGIGSPPGSPGHAPPPTHSRGGTALSGSRQLEEQQFQELDSVLARGTEVDALHALAACPMMVAAAPALWVHRFMDQLPALLNASTAPAEFQAATARLLLGNAAGAQVLAVLRAE